MKKILYILNIANRVNNFSYTSMIAAQELGMEYHIAGNWSYESAEERALDESKYGIHIHQIDFYRQPYHPKNITAYRQLERLMQEERFDAIHCNTPIGGVTGRLLGRNSHVKSVIYQAHGFHFYKGAPLLNWLLYYPVEKFLAHDTDAIITINKEDYHMAGKKLKPRGNGMVYYVPGVGIDPTDFDSVQVNIEEKRNSLGLTMADTVLISMGDLIARKNYPVSLQAVAQLNNPNLKYLICGEGPELERLKSLAQSLKISKQVQFLGYRTDVKELIKLSDIFLFTTLQEGLPRALSEAMAGGLACVASNIRGNCDLIQDGKGGFLCQPQDVQGIARALERLAEDEELRTSMGSYNRRAIEQFSISTVVHQLKEIYQEVIRL